MELETPSSHTVWNVDLRCFPNVETHCLRLTEAITALDYSGFILSATQTSAGDKKLAELAAEVLENYSGNYVPQGANLVDAYLALYHQIKIVMQVVAQLETAIGIAIESGE